MCVWGGGLKPHINSVKHGTWDHTGLLAGFREMALGLDIGT